MSNTGATQSSTATPPIGIIRFRPEDILQSTGNNFTAWKKLVLILFRAQGVIKIINGTLAKPAEEDPTYEDWYNKDSRALAQLGTNMELALMADLTVESSHAMWSALVTWFDTTNPLNRSLALSELHNYKISSSHPIKKRISELHALHAQYINASGELSDSEWLNIIMQSLTERWSPLATLGNFISNPEKFLNTLISEEKCKLQNGEMKPFNSDSTNSNPEYKDTESALIATATPDGMKMKNICVCADCETPGHSKPCCYAPGGGQANNPPDWYLEKQRNKNGAKTESANTTFTRHEAY